LSAGCVSDEFFLSSSHFSSLASSCAAVAHDGRCARDATRCTRPPHHRQPDAPRIVAFHTARHLCDSLISGQR